MKEVIKFELKELSKDLTSDVLARLDEKMKKVITDVAIAEAERQERVVMLAMGKNYLTLRKAADALYEAAQHPIRNRKALKKALADYKSECNLTVITDAFDIEKYMSGVRGNVR